MRWDWPFNSGDRREPADGRHVAFVKVMEIRARFSLEILQDHFCGMHAHLHRGLRNTGQFLPVLYEVGEITTDKDFGMINGIERRSNHDASTPIGLHTKQAAEW